MSYEVQCGECSEVILIEDLGVEVSCPHCEAVLILHESDIAAAEESGSTDERAALPKPPEEPAEEPIAEKRDESIPNFDFLGETQETAELPSFKIDVTAGSPPAATAEADRPEITENSQQQPATTEDRPADSDTEPRDRSNRRSARGTGGVPDLVYKSLLSYSIFVTIALLYLIYSYRTAKPHLLESLPDIHPMREGEFQIIPETASLPIGHSLHLGETQRFGNIKVTPLRVNREPIRFVHFQGEGAGSKPSSAPVLKLWLKIENVSEDQKFAPLDQELALLRHVDPKDYQNEMSHTWICRLADLHSKTKRILMYDHPPTSNYNIVGMANTPIGPGDSIETFLPSQDEELEKLQGKLVWRIQIRKGFNPESMNGVTTLIDVIFDSNDISKG